VATCGTIIGCEANSGIDYGMNTFNVGEHLSSDEDYPFVGFWKMDPSEESGLAIKKGPDGKYAIWFCAARGSTEIESLSPTTLIDDKNFKVINDDTIEILDKSGGQFQTYVRIQ
jgi:hypothetical protein